MKTVKSLLLVVLLALSCSALYAQSTTLDLSKEGSITAVSTSVTSVLEVTTTSGASLFNISYTGVEVNKYQVKAFNNAEVVYNSQVAGPAYPVELSFKKEVVYSACLAADDAIGWLRALRLLPCVEGEYNSDGSWYVRFDCYGSRVAGDGSDTVPVEIDGVPVASY